MPLQQREVTPLPPPCCEALAFPTGPEISTQRAHILGSQTSTQEPAAEGASYSTAVQFRTNDGSKHVYHLLPEKSACD